MPPWWQDRSTVTTLVGTLLGIGLGVVDAGWLHLFGREADAALIGAGIGALLGHNPFAGTPVMAVTPPARPTS